MMACVVGVPRGGNSAATFFSVISTLAFSAASLGSNLSSIWISSIFWPLTPPCAFSTTMKNLDLDIRTGEMTVVTGRAARASRVLSSTRCMPKGQRLCRDLQRLRAPVPRPHGPPAVDRVDGVPPAIAIDQTNPVRSSRSTVGTMTELNDHLKLLFARARAAVRPDTAQPVHAGTSPVAGAR